MELDVYKEWLGIPEAPRPPDHYTLLRLVQFEDDTEKIRKNYKKLNTHVRKYATGEHSEASQHLLNELARAMLCLTDPERKREYDESQGREFADSDQQTRKPLTQILVEQGKIGQAQADEVSEFAEKRGLSARDAVVQMKLVDATVATEAYAQELGVSFVDLSEMIPEDEVLDQLPRNVVKRHSILPLFVDDDVLLVACSEDISHELEEELRLRYSVPVRRVLATPRSISQGIAQYYAPGVRDEAVAGSTPKAGKAGQPKVRKAASQLEPEELRERKMMGILLMCWGVIGSVLVDQFVLSNIMPGAMILGFLSTYIVAPAVIFYVLKVYWK